MIILSANIQTLEDVFAVFREYFLPAYANLVGYIGDKPKEIVFELENILSHLSQCYNPQLDDSEKQLNIGKAYGHVVRVTLDCYKLLWVEINKDLEEFKADDGHCFKLACKESEFNENYASFKSKAQAARHKEMVSIGVSPLDSVELYREVIKDGLKLLKMIDHDKAEKFKKFNFWCTLRDHAWSLVVGFAAGILANYTCMKYL